MHLSTRPKKSSESTREPVLAVAPVRGAEPRARRAAHVVPPGGQGRQPRRRPGQEQEAAAPRAVDVPLTTAEEALCRGTQLRIQFLAKYTQYADNLKPSNF